MTASAFRFQISDFRFQIPSPRPSRFLLSDFRFQISDFRPPRRRNFAGNQIPKHAEHISRLQFRILLGTDFRFQIPEFSRGPRAGSSRFQISDFCPATDFRFQISENKGAGLDPKGREISDFRFQISGVGCPLVWDVHCRFQISDFSAARGSGVSDFSVSDFRKHKSGPIGQEISIVCQGENQKKARADPKEKHAITSTPETCAWHASTQARAPCKALLFWNAHVVYREVRGSDQCGESGRREFSEFLHTELN